MIVPSTVFARSPSRAISARHQWSAPHDRPCGTTDYSTTASSRPSRCGDLADPAELVPDAERDVVRRAFGAPGVEERAGARANRIREFVLPIRKVGPGIDSPSAAMSFSRPSAVWVSPRIVTGPSLTFISIDRPAPDLPWYSFSARSDGPSVGDRQVAGAVVAHQHELLVEVQRVELGVRAAGAEPVEQQHGDVGLEVALAGRRDAARREQRVAHDQAGGDALGHVAVDAAVVVGQPVELEVSTSRSSPTATRDDQAKTSSVIRPGDRVAAGIGELERCADLVALARDRRRVRGLDAWPRGRRSRAPRRAPGLRVHLGEVRVHVEHPRIGVAQEADAARGAGRRPPRPRRPTRAISSQAGSPSTSVPVTVRYGMRARVNAPASSGTQQAEQFASHSPVVIAS